MGKAKSVCILDYGSGNVHSVYNLIRSITKAVTISNEIQHIVEASHIVLPGVGAFGATMDKIRKTLPLKVLEAQIIEQKKPFLGICVGMQVLATTGLEFGHHQGLNWIPGTVSALNSGSLPLPHVGWNNIQPIKTMPIFHDLGQHLDFYFVHSYCFNPEDKKYVIAKTDYPNPFCAVIQKENIIGVQFHPEKSQQAGRKIVQNFLEVQ